MLAALNPAALEDPTEGSAYGQDAVLPCGNFVPHARIAAAACIPLLVLGVVAVKEWLRGVKHGPVFFQRAELQLRKLEVLCFSILSEHDDQFHAQLVVRENDNLHGDGYFLFVPGLADELQPLLVLLGQHTKNNDGDVALPDVSDLHAGRVCVEL